jgi:competence protein ComEA
VPLSEQLRTRYGWEPRGVAVLALLGVLGVALALGVVWRGRASEVGPTNVASGSSSPVAYASSAAEPDPVVVSTSASGRPSVSQRADPVIVVDVVGAVAQPGVVRLREGSRVVDAISAAGGVLPGTETSGLNLARLVADGEQVAVGIPPAGPSPGPSGPVAASSPAASTGDPLDLNTATASDLERLPGVGPVLAGRIIEWRTRNGRFASVDELNEVSGIGEATFAELAPLVRVSTG